MINFTDKNDNTVLSLKYTTYITSTQLIVVKFDIININPLFNGEFLYYTVDDIGEKTLLYKSYEDAEFDSINLEVECNSLRNAFVAIGNFIETIRNCVMLYDRNLNLIKGVK